MITTPMVIAASATLKIRKGRNFAEMKVGEIDDIAEIVAILDIAERPAENQRQRRGCRRAAFSRIIQMVTTSAISRGHRHQAPAHFRAGRLEHAQRDAEIAREAQVEDRQQFHHRRAVDAERLGDVILLH